MGSPSKQEALNNLTVQWTVIRHSLNAPSGPFRPLFAKSQQKHHYYGVSVLRLASGNFARLFKERVL